jgi:hypothetical protein
MGKQQNNNRKRRRDLVGKKLPTLYAGTKHSAYLWMRKCKQGQSPPGNTNVAKALAAIETELIKHFGELNAPQQIQLNLLRPLFAFWLLHPVTLEEGSDKLASDFKWVHGKLESGLRVLCDLADSEGGGDGPDLYEQMRQQYWANKAKEKAEK